MCTGRGEPSPQAVRADAGVSRSPASRQRRGALAKLAASKQCWDPWQPPRGSGGFFNLPPSPGLDSSSAEQKKSLITSWSEDLSDPFSRGGDEVWARALGGKAKAEGSRGMPTGTSRPRLGLSAPCGNRDEEASG